MFSVLLIVMVGPTYDMADVYVAAKYICGDLAD